MPGCKIKLSTIDSHRRTLYEQDNNDRPAPWVREEPEGVFQESGGRVKGFGPKPADGTRFHWDQKGTSTDWGTFPDERGTNLSSFARFF